MKLALPDFRLEVYLGEHEFCLRHHLTASDAQTLTISELLAYGTDDDRTAFDNLGLTYIATWGTEPLREAIATTYEHVDGEHVLCFSGAEEAMFWALQVLLEPGDHAVVTVPNYQSMEEIPIAVGAEVTGLPLWEGEGASLRWTLDLDRLRALLRPTTRVVAVNVPNNPTGFVPDQETWRALIELCDERGIRVLSDEVYRGLEVDRARMLPQAADLSETAVSLNVMSKAYGMPGLRTGWLACRCRALLERLERCKHYTTICNAGPSEFLATLALRNAEPIRARNRAIITQNLTHLDTLFAKHADLVDWRRSDGGCVAFPRYLGANGVEAFCASLITEHSAVLLPASISASSLAVVPADRFRIGFGRANMREGWAALDEHLTEQKR